MPCRAGRLIAAEIKNESRNRRKECVADGNTDRHRHQRRRTGGDRTAVFPGVGDPTSPGIKPYGPLELAGREVYVREGCYLCHTQMVRPLQAEVERYAILVAGEAVYDHPFQFGSKRTGRIWRASAAAIRTSGIASTSTIRAMWSPNPICPPSRGWRRTASIPRTSPRRCACYGSRCALHRFGNRIRVGQSGRPHRTRCAGGLSARFSNFTVRCRHDRHIPRRNDADPAVVLVAIVAWAWSGRRKAVFDSMARMALDDDSQPTSNLPTVKEAHHE